MTEIPRENEPEDTQDVPGATWDPRDSPGAPLGPIGEAPGPSQTTKTVMYLIKSTTPAAFD